MRGACLVVFLVACGGASVFTEQPDGPVTVTVPDARAPDASAGVWTTLAATTWTLQPGETYQCVRVTVDHDTYISGFDPIAPLGTHHTVLGVTSNPTVPDGVVECSGLVVEPQILFASGVGTQRIDLPPGIAVKVSKGQQVILNLHLFNTSDLPLSGTSGIKIHEVDPAGLTAEAEVLLAGPVGFSIPMGLQKIDGTCTFTRAATIFAVGPHMHKLGVHMTAKVGTTMLLDRDYSFDAQTFSAANVQVAPGDRITTECTYANDTGGPVMFGPSTNDEMCFLFVYRYPAGGQFSICTL